MRKKIVAGNWKMNKTGDEAINFANQLKAEIANIKKTEMIICPPATAIVSMSNILKDTNAKIGAQNVYWEESGAFTGELSTAMLENAGCDYVIIGHSERRQYFGETNETVNKRINAVLKSKLTAIVCVGETLEERENGKTNDVVGSQIKEGLVNINSDEVQKLILAYEPVWAIGTGVTATPAQAEEVHNFIRKLLADMYSPEISERIHILYGGSVKPGNIKELLTQQNIDGGLIGGASLDVNSYIEMVKITEQL